MAKEDTPLSSGSKRKKGYYTLEPLPEPTPRPRRCSPSRAERFDALPPLKGPQQHPPIGTILGRWTPPRGWRPFYKRDCAFDMPANDVWLPKVSTSMGYKDPSLKARVWDHELTFEDNAGHVLDLLAGVLEPPPTFQGV